MRTVRSADSDEKHDVTGFCVYLPEAFIAIVECILSADRKIKLAANSLLRDFRSSLVQFVVTVCLSRHGLSCLMLSRIVFCNVTWETGL